MDTPAASPSASGSGAAQDGPAELDLEDPSGRIAHPAAGGGGQTSSRDYATASNAPSTSHNTAIPSSSSTTHASGASRPTPSSLGIVDASSNSNSGNPSAGRLGGFLSSNKSSKLVNAEAATAAALIGNLDSPSLSNVSPTTATSSSIDSASHINNNAISGVGGSSSNKNTPKAGEGTITNTAAVGPPTPSATRLPFLPSALKKGSSSFKTNPVPSSSAAPANATSPSLSSDPLVTAGGNFLSNKKGKKAARANTIRNAFSSSSSAGLKDVNQDDSGAADTSMSSTASQTVNAYEKSYNASAAKVHSKRDREEAREAREKERLYGSNLVLQPTSSNSRSNMERTKIPGGNSMTGGNTLLASSHSQETPSLGFASPHMSPALLEAGQANDRFTRQDSYMRSGTSAQNNFNGEGDMSISKSRGLGGANNNRMNLTKEEEEDILAAQLGGGIGPTTSRIKKSTKKAPTSPNNVQGEKLAAEMEKEQDAYISSKKKNAITAAVSGGGLAGSKKRVRANGNEEKDDIEAARGTATTINAAKKDTQLQFSPKVSKPFNISWRAIKRKLLLASTGTPSSGEGSRRSETSETSGGSRHRMYVQNPGTGGAAPHGEKQVHIQGVDDGLAEEDWEVDQVRFWKSALTPNDI